MIKDLTKTPNRNKDHSRGKQRKRNHQAGKEKKIIYVGNLHENVTGSDLGKVFGLRRTNYSKDNCFIKKLKLQQNRRINVYEYILVPCYVCHDFVKLHSLEFHGCKIIVEQAKTTRTLAIKLSTTDVENRL